MHNYDSEMLLSPRMHWLSTQESTAPRVSGRFLQSFCSIFHWSFVLHAESFKHLFFSPTVWEKRSANLSFYFLTWADKLHNKRLIVNILPSSSHTFAVSVQWKWLVVIRIVFLELITWLLRNVMLKWLTSGLAYAILVCMIHISEPNKKEKMFKFSVIVEK